MLDYAEGDAIDMHGVLQAYPIRLLSIHEYVQRLLVNEPVG